MSSKPKKNRTKQYLMLLTVAGLIAIVGGSSSGTFASFTAEVTNTGNYFATGTLLLHDNGGTTTCTSEAASNNANNASTNGCDILFDLKDPTKPQFAHLTLTNAGSLNAKDIKFDTGATPCTPAVHTLSTTVDTAGIGLDASISSIPVVSTQAVAKGDLVFLTDSNGNSQTFTASGPTAASASPTTIAIDTATTTFAFPSGSTVTNGPTFSGTDLCQGLQVVIVETADDTFNGNSLTAGAGTLGCAWGLVSTTSCAFDSLHELSTLPPAASPVALTQADGTTAQTLAAGQSRYFLIAINPLTSVDNSFQNEGARFDLHWKIEQA